MAIDPAPRRPDTSIEDLLKVPTPEQIQETENAIQKYKNISDEIQAATDEIIGDFDF